MKVPILILLVFLFALVLGANMFSKTVYVESSNHLRLLSTDTKSSVIRVPAVDTSGNGVVTEITVNIEPGIGRTLINLDILSFLDTQNSILVARNVAQNVTGLDLSNHDIIYTIKANASIIEGPSAGAALTIVTIAALQDIELDPKIMITGSINPDNTIGRVGKIKEKARAAKLNGASLFLVPSRELISLNEFETVVNLNCEKLNDLEICETSYDIVDVPRVNDIEIVEVKNIEQAIEYFVGGDKND